MKKKKKRRVIHVYIHRGKRVVPIPAISQLSREITPTSYYTNLDPIYTLTNSIVSHIPSIPTHRPSKYKSITPPILPPSPPPLLPKPTIKFLLPQLPIHLIMRLTHPRPEIRPPPQPRLITSTRLRHPVPEIIRTHPAGVQARENLQERPHLALLFLRRLHGV